MNREVVIYPAMNLLPLDHSTGDSKGIYSGFIIKLNIQVSFYVDDNFKNENLILANQLSPTSIVITTTVSIIATVFLF